MELQEPRRLRVRRREKKHGGVEMERESNGFGDNKRRREDWLMLSLKASDETMRVSLLRKPRSVSTKRPREYWASGCGIVAEQNHPQARKKRTRNGPMIRRPKSSSDGKLRISSPISNSQSVPPGNDPKRKRPRLLKHEGGKGELPLAHSYLDHGFVNKEELSIVESNASNSSPALYPPPITKYDVFLSFRGEDTRDNFTSHLYDTLCRAAIDTYIDYRLDRGGEISPSLEKAIEESQIFVIIFSKDYASSTWCLDELVKILECKERDGRIVIPVFYNIDPSNVRKQTGSYADAFLKHEKRFKGHNEDRVQEWKDALFQAANLSGWDSTKIRPESKLIKEIVKDILVKLNCVSSCNLEGLVGIQKHIANMEELLGIGSLDVLIMGIWGMGGIGKTTIADVMFHKLKAQFESCSFVANVREQLIRNGLENLQNKCLTELLGEDFGTCSIRSPFVKSRLQRKKILLVLDDIDNSLRADDLIKVSHWLGPGSRIIITSRDKHVLKNVGAKELYHVQGMNRHDALQLFSLKAFHENQPAKNYVDLSKRVVNYCKGIPLALIVLGSFLYGRTEEEWRSALAKLKKAPEKEIFDVLKVSFDGLDDAQKVIFLDLACFFSKRKKAPTVRDMSNYYELPDVDISVLIERCLISVNAHGLISMHDLVRAMGEEISQQLGKNPGQPIRLWKDEDICRALSNNTANERIRSIFMDISKIKGSLNLAAFRNAHDMIYLNVCKSNSGEPSRMCIDGGLESLPNELRILHWIEYPLPSLPLRFCIENLVELIMIGSHLERLWDGDLILPNLKILKLSGSRQLIELPNLSQTYNLEELDLLSCYSLVQVYSLRSLFKLWRLDFSYCYKLESVNFASLNCKIVRWEGCPLRCLPLSFCSENLIHLYMPYNNLERLWDGDQVLPNLKYLNLKASQHLIELPNLSACNMEELCLNGCVSLVRVYSSSSFFKLKHLDLDHCEKLMNVEFAPVNCKNVYWECCPLQSLPLSFFPKTIVKLLLRNSHLEQLWDGDQHLPSLEEICLVDSRQLIELPDLSQAPNIKTLSLYGCSRLVQVYSSSFLYKLRDIYLRGCHMLRNLHLARNIHRRSSVLVACYNYFDLENFSLIKVNLSLSISNLNNKPVLRLKVVSVPYTEICECLDSAHSAELQLLGKLLASSLPNLSSLRWLHFPSSIGQFNKLFELHSCHEAENKKTKLKLLRRSSKILEPRKSLTHYPCTKGSTIKEVSSPLEQLMDSEEDLTKDVCVFGFNGLLRIPNDMIHLSFITVLTLQKSDIVSVPTSIPGFSSLISLAACDCRSCPPIIDLSISEDSKGRMSVFIQMKVLGSTLDFWLL